MTAWPASCPIPIRRTRRPSWRPPSMAGGTPRGSPGGTAVAALFTDAAQASRLRATSPPGWRALAARTGWCRPGSPTHRAAADRSRRKLSPGPVRWPGWLSVGTQPARTIRSPPAACTTPWPAASARPNASHVRSTEISTPRSGGPSGPPPCTTATAASWRGSTASSAGSRGAVLAQQSYLLTAASPRCSRCAMVAASTRFRTPSLVRMFETCTLTVLSLM
jgi:hypothetical protein